MSKGKKSKSEILKIAQHRRTHKNKVKKYEKFLANFPEHKARKEWKKKLEHSQSQT